VPGVEIGDSRLAEQSPTQAKRRAATRRGRRRGTSHWPRPAEMKQLFHQQFPDGCFFGLGPVSFAPGGANGRWRAWLSRDVDRPGGSDRRSEAGALVF